MHSFLIPRSCERYLPRQKVNIILSSIWVFIDVSIFRLSYHCRLFWIWLSSQCLQEKSKGRLYTHTYSQGHPSTRKWSRINTTEKPRGFKKSLKPLQAVKGEEWVLSVCDDAFISMSGSGLQNWGPSSREFVITTPLNYFSYLIYLTQSVKVYLDEIPSN